MQINHSNFQTFKGSWTINDNARVYNTDNAGDRHCWDTLWAMGNNTIIDCNKSIKIKNMMRKNDPRHPNDKKEQVIYKKYINDSQDRVVCRNINKKGQRPVNPNLPDEKQVNALNLLGQKLELSILGERHTARIINPNTGNELLKFVCKTKAKTEHIEDLHKDSKPLGNPVDDLLARVLAMIGQNKKGDNND